MNQRRSAKSSPASAGLGAIIIQALESIASRDASEAVVSAALEKAGLRKLPEDPVVLLAFLSGALYQAAAARLGEEFADAMLADSRPILERAAAHAMALEEQPRQDEDPFGPAPSEEPLPEPPKPLALEPDEPSPLETAAMGGSPFEPELGFEAPIPTEPGLPFEPEFALETPSPTEPGLPFEPELGFEVLTAADDGLPFEPLPREVPGAAEPELPFVPLAVGTDDAVLDRAPALEEPGTAEPELPFVPEFPLEPPGTRAGHDAGAPQPSTPADRPGSSRTGRKRQTAPGLSQKRQTAPGVGKKARQTSPGGARRRQSAPAVPKKRPTSPGVGIKKRQTSPGVGLDAVLAVGVGGGGGTELSAGPAASVRRPSIDPKRLTLGYEAVVDEPTDGQGSRLCAVVAMADRTLRSIVARILRREGIGVVTAPDGSVGLLLAQRFGAGLVVVDAAGAAATAAPSPSGPPVVLLDPDASSDTAVELSEGRARVAAKPLDPASLVQAIEQLLPQGWRR